MKSRLNRNAKFEPRVAASLHVNLPLRIPGEVRLPIAGLAGRGRASFPGATHREGLQQLSIEPYIEPLRPSLALEIVLILPLQTDLDEILAADRKFVAHRDPAARSKRQVFTL